jgi:hypothetical protein
MLLGRPSVIQWPMCKETICISGKTELLLRSQRTVAQISSMQFLIGFMKKRFSETGTRSGSRLTGSSWHF